MAEPEPAAAVSENQHEESVDSETSAALPGREAFETDEKHATDHIVNVPDQTQEFEKDEDEASRLRQLAATARDQDELEKDIGRQADQMLLDQANERDQKRLDRTNANKEKLVAQVRKLQQRLQAQTGTANATRLRAEIQHLQPQIDALNDDLVQIQERIDERNRDGRDADGEAADHGGNRRLPGESRRDFLIRTGKITPFSKMGQALQGDSSNLADVMLEAEGGESEDDEAAGFDEQDQNARPLSHRNLLKPGFAQDDTSDTDPVVNEFSLRPRKRRRGLEDPETRQAKRSPLHSSAGVDAEDEFDPNGITLGASSSSDSDEWTSVAQSDSLEGTQTTNKRSKRTRRSSRRSYEQEEAVEDLTGVDDGNEHIYMSRLNRWVAGRQAARRKEQAKALAQDSRTDTEAASGTGETSNFNNDAEAEEEWLMPHPKQADTEFEGGFRIPGDIYPSLFDYQKTGVQWLWELYSQQAGGIVGDEMGLGKTIQVIAFLAGLHHSNLLKKPVIVVTPATVMKQWVHEFHLWWPPLRVSILHTSGSGMMDVRRERMIEDELEYDNGRTSVSGTSGRSAKKIVDRVVREGHVLVTTYSGLQSYADLILPVYWGYAVLDEGHKIRNPNAKITIYSKTLRTANRIILSGTPMQNNLTELWSLFDFVFPLRLGNLVSFRTQFEIPIKQGGYANASNLQVETALKCAETLKDAISPYLLQRFKIDVAADLPKKSEQVLFCRLTRTQRDAYESFLASPEMTSILAGKRQALYGIDMLRKICNHPDLQDHKLLSIKPGYNYGNAIKSGKMQVVKALLELWRDTGHKTLLFAQHRIMLNILERFIRTLEGFRYRRMDGTTQIKDRQDLVDEFNSDPSLHVFLLTTKVGGLGVNLTGADRVIIYDPDWNPSTDVQARERAWRLGQKREVMIYRLMTAGTIEEKIYHRQIFKQFLTNKILRDPKQRQTFQLKDLHDLFTLGDADDATETSSIFKTTEVKFDKVSTTADTNADPNESGDTKNLNSIVGIAHREDFRTPDDEQSTNTPAITQTSPDKPATAASNDESGVAKPPNNNNVHLLSSIFSRSDVQSAVEHDAIINGRLSSSRSKITADPEIISREAKKVAAAAAAELQRASQVARNTPVGTPTWTGVFGSGGRPEERPPRPFGRSRGPSSASVLANLAARQGNAAPPDLINGSGAPESSGGDEQQQQDPQPRGREFLELIRNYLVAHGGAVYTQMLIDHFNHFCQTPERTAEFKEMLRAIAVLDKGPEQQRGAGAARSRGRLGRRREQERSRGGRARWVLKAEFGGSA